MFPVLGAVVSQVLAVGVSLSVAPDAPCLTSASLTRQLEQLGVQVVSRQAALDVDVTRTEGGLRLRARRRGDDQLLLRTVPAPKAECAAAERVVALLVRSWADTAHLRLAESADAGQPPPPAEPRLSPELIANPLADIQVPKAPPVRDDTPPIPPRPPEPLRRTRPEPAKPAADEPPGPVAVAPVAVAPVAVAPVAVAPVDAAPGTAKSEPPPALSGPGPRRIVYPQGSDESTVNTARGVVESAAPKPISALAVERAGERDDEEPASDGGTADDASTEDLKAAEAPIQPPSAASAGVTKTVTPPPPSRLSPYRVLVALVVGGAFGVAPGASPSGEWVAGVARGHLGVWLDLGFTLGPSPQTSAGTVTLNRAWLSLAFGTLFRPTETLEWGAALGVRGFRLGIGYSGTETDLLAVGAVAQAFVSARLAGPFSLWLRGFFSLRTPADRLAVEGRGTILTLQPWDAGAEAGLGLRFE